MMGTRQKKTPVKSVSARRKKKLPHVRRRNSGAARAKRTSGALELYATFAAIGVLALVAVFFMPQSPFFLYGYAGSLADISWNFISRDSEPPIICSGEWKCWDSVCVCGDPLHSAMDASPENTVVSDEGGIFRSGSYRCAGEPLYPAPTILAPSGVSFVPLKKSASLLVTGTGSRKGASINLFSGDKVIGGGEVYEFASPGGTSYRWRINVHDLPEGVNVITASENSWGNESPRSHPYIVVVGGDSICENKG